MNIRDLIRKVLNETYQVTETDYLGWSVPEHLYPLLEDIGVKLWNKNSDVIYIAEIQFDNKSVVFEILTSEGEIYDNDPGIPVTYKSYHRYKIEDLPKEIKNFIIRRLEVNWIDYLNQ